jgi:hypothetical protein
VDLNEVAPFDFAQERSAAALVNPQKRFENVQGAAVDVEASCNSLPLVARVQASSIAPDSPASNKRVSASTQAAR